MMQAVQESAELYQGVHSTLEETEPEQIKKLVAIPSRSLYFVEKPIEKQVEEGEAEADDDDEPTTFWTAELFPNDKARSSKLVDDWLSKGSRSIQKSDMMLCFGSGTPSP